MNACSENANVSSNDANATNDDCDFIALTKTPIDIGEAYKFVVEAATGATSMFVGTTRDTFENKKVIKLSYEAYEPMALKELKLLCENARKKFQINKICILHRLGEVPVTEASVVIAVSSVHRKDSLDAVEDLIDTLKERVPIWKKEIYEDGASEWKENKECCWRKQPKAGEH